MFHSGISIESETDLGETFEGLFSKFSGLKPLMRVTIG